jgi:hypothetical protein
MTIQQSATTYPLSRRAQLLSGVAMAALAAFSPVTAAAKGEDTLNQKENNVTATITQRDAAPDTASDVIRPFTVHIPQEALDDLKRRLTATRWPDQETVTDDSRGSSWRS